SPCPPSPRWQRAWTRFWKQVRLAAQANSSYCPLWEERPLPEGLQFWPCSGECNCFQDGSSVKEPSSTRSPGSMEVSALLSLSNLNAALYGATASRNLCF